MIALMTDTLKMFLTLLVAKAFQGSNYAKRTQRIF